MENLFKKNLIQKIMIMILVNLVARYVKEKFGRNGGSISYGCVSNGKDAAKSSVVQDHCQV